MTNKPAKNRPPDHAALDLRELQARVETLQLELAQKNLEMAQKDLLVNQGHQAFLQAAEKLQEFYKRLQQKVAGLNLELDEKNKELEGNLAELETVKNSLSNIFESQAHGMFVTDLEGKVRRVNRAGLQLLGAKVEALTGMHINHVLRRELLPKAVKGASAASELEFDETISLVRDDGEALTLRAGLTTMTGENREPQGYIVNVQDITLLKKLEEHAARRDRFTAMGEMAANIAHEIRNPLGSIELFTTLVKKGLPADDAQLELVNHITNGVASMNHIISNLLEYTKPKPVSLQRVDLHRLVNGTVEFTRFSASQNQVQLNVDLQARHCRINGDAELLKQVFHNLILNAVQAMPEGGALNIASRQRTLTNPSMLSRMEDRAGAGKRRREAVELSFKDDGAGMPEDIRRQIFDPFFTTKSRGTGLGLAIAHTIVESHHGVIDVESAVGQGTSFILMFPTVEK